MGSAAVVHAHKGSAEITSSSSNFNGLHGHAGIPQGRLLSPADVAERLGVSERTLASWRHGEVRSTSGPPWLAISAGVIRYPEGDLECWLRARRRS